MLRKTARWILAILLFGELAQALETDRFEPQSLHAVVRGWSGYSLPPQPEGIEAWLRAGNRQRGAHLAWRARLSPAWNLDVMVIGTDHRDAQTMFNTNKTKGDWSGRLLRGQLRYRSSGIDLDLGRDRLGVWTDGEDALTLGMHQGPVDLARLVLKLPNWGLRLETLAAGLPTPQHDQGFRRWLGGHELCWEQGPWLASIGDLVIYTGWRRTLEPAYLNPFLPAFVGNFEGVAEIDSLTRRDNDNNLLHGHVGWRKRRGAWGGRIRLDVVVDEFQMDAVDRADTKDVLGLRLLSVADYKHASGIWQAGLAAARLSSWLYQHPGLETDWVADGRGLGHPDGGDLLEARVHLAWLPVEPTLGANGLWADGSGVFVTAGLQRKGDVQLADDWDPTSTVNEGLPIDPEIHRSWWGVDARLGWRLGPRLRIQLCLEQEHWQGGRPSTRGDGDLEASLRLGVLLPAPGEKR